MMSGIRADTPDEFKGNFVISDFSGGMRRNVDPTGLNDNEYAVLQNGRNRGGGIATIKGPEDFTGLIPAGKKQGIYGFNNILIVMSGGRAWGRDFSDETSGFNHVPGLLMDENIDRIFAEIVPASWQNLQRKLSDETDVTAGVKLVSEVFGTPAAMVVQDGVTRPWLVFTTGNARPAKDFGDWRNDEDAPEDTREYVPIGKQMMYSDDGRLYIVSPDGTEIYRSVTGRPLDFVVAIDKDGEKLPALSSGKPEASRLSYRLAYDPITCIRNVPSAPRVQDEEAGFYVSTKYNSWIVYPHYRQPLYGEPTFSNQRLFPTGALNQYSLTDILGDTGVITESGITSFNSILTASNEGKNLPFHDYIHKLFEGIIQSITCSITSDNYAFFGVQSVYGGGILVYDTLRSQYTSFDVFPEITGYIKQFAEIKVSGQRRLFFITSGDQLFEAFAGETSTCRIYTKEFTSGEAEVQLIPRRVRLIFDELAESGEATVTIFVNGKPGTPMTKTVNVGTNPPQTIPISFPFGTVDAETTKNKTFTIEQPIKGLKVGIQVEFNFNAQLQQIELIVDGEESAATDVEQGEIFNEVKTI